MGLISPMGAISQMSRISKWAASPKAANGLANGRKRQRERAHLAAQDVPFRNYADNQAVGDAAQFPLKNTYSATITTANAVHAMMTPRLGFSASFTTLVSTVACLLHRLTTTIIATKTTKM